MISVVYDHDLLGCRGVRSSLDRRRKIPQSTCAYWVNSTTIKEWFDGEDWRSIDHRKSSHDLYNQSFMLSRIWSWNHTSDIRSHMGL